MRTFVLTLRQFVFASGVMLGALCGFEGSAQAQQNIGAAAVANNEVSRELSGASARLGVGDPVFINEVVRTGIESTAKLVFLDSTNLAVGPIARVILDRFIYDPSRSSVDGVGVKLAKGIFRFTTGVLAKKDYSVTTPTAAIGVRGTVLDIAVNAGSTRVTLRKGGALVCPIKKGTTFEQQARDCAKGHSAHCDCVDLTNPGQTAQVTKIGGANRASSTTLAVQFAALCSGSLCSAQSYASLGVSPTLAGATPSPGESPDLGASPSLAAAGGGASLCGR
jgi:hypothetical protein